MYGDFYYIQEPDYSYPPWEDLCTRLCNSICLTSHQFLVSSLKNETVIQAVTITYFTDDSKRFNVLLSNTTKFLPSPITWQSCIHIKGKSNNQLQDFFHCNIVKKKWTNRFISNHTLDMVIQTSLHINLLQLTRCNWSVIGQENVHQNLF